MESYVRNCLIKSRPEDRTTEGNLPLIGEDESGVFVRLDSYAIVPRVEYESLRSQLAANLKLQMDLAVDLEALGKKCTQLEADREYNAELVRERDERLGAAERVIDSMRQTIINCLVNTEVLENANGIIPREKPTHGPCCTCQECGRDYDNCVCDHNNHWKALESDVFSVLQSYRAKYPKEG